MLMFVCLFVGCHRLACFTLHALRKHPAAIDNQMEHRKNTPVIVPQQSVCCCHRLAGEVCEGAAERAPRLRWIWATVAQKKKKKRWRRNLLELIDACNPAPPPKL
jgi:hypothetical protein